MKTYTIENQSYHKIFDRDFMIQMTSDLVKVRLMQN